MVLRRRQTPFFKTRANPLLILEIAQANHGASLSNYWRTLKRFATWDTTSPSHVFEGKDACVTLVLELDEVNRHPHNRERGLLMDLEGLLRPAPAPRLSRTPGKVQKPGKPRGSETREILREIGYSTEEIRKFYENKVVE